eukprot:GEMP01035933.1.p1 GENE.GEMP01035933.1~~GEMP01035933.1.p1  ORF type:complete len:428 (+),score=120.10 GEMP01035933.1:57-1340(+)
MRLQHFLNSTLVDFLLTLSPGKAYPLMDLLPTDIEDIAYVIDQVVPATLLRRLEGDPVMDVNWFDMAQSAEGPGYFSSLNVSVNSDASLDGWDGDYCNAINSLLDGGDSVSVESNEWKWTDLQMRYSRGEFSPTWVAGVCTVLLFAADVMATEIGPGLRRSMRGVHIAQALAMENQLPASELAVWPAWRLLASISAQLQDPNRQTSQRTGVSREPPPIEKYLSIIVQARNDDYAGRMLERFNNFLQTSAYLLEKAGVDDDFAEILVVEWNPPSNAGPLAEAIQQLSAKIPIRVITVPKEVHESIPHHKAHPLFEHVAENVAFRRAKGRFVLKTNIDNIWSPALAHFLAKRTLREDNVYRATYLEYDVVEAELNGQPEALLSWLFEERGLREQAAEKLETLMAMYPEDVHVCESGSVIEDHPGATTPW